MVTKRKQRAYNKLYVVRRAEVLIIATIEISYEPSLWLGTSLITRVRRLVPVLLIKQILSLERLLLELLLDQVIKWLN